MQLRRHGDIFERLPGSYYTAKGRSDDTMNLGGIKVQLRSCQNYCKTDFKSLETLACWVAPGEVTFRAFKAVKATAVSM